MRHQYYLSPVYGDGKTEPYHTKLIKYPVACASTIVAGKDGELIDDVALCLVSASEDEHASLYADHELMPCRDHVDAIGKSIEFGKQLRESRRAIAAMKLVHTADLKLELERRAERAYKAGV